MKISSRTSIYFNLHNKALGLLFTVAIFLASCKNESAKPKTGVQSNIEPPLIPTRHLYVSLKVRQLSISVSMASHFTSDLDPRPIHKPRNRHVRGVHVNEISHDGRPSYYVVMATSLVLCCAAVDNCISYDRSTWYRSGQDKMCHTTFHT